MAKITDAPGWLGTSGTRPRRRVDLVRGRGRPRRSSTRRPTWEDQLGDVWFIIAAFFWVGFFVLEGFDFGVGMLHSFIGRNDLERRVLDQHDRAGLGRQRGVAHRGGGGDLCRLPGLVRHHVLDPVPGRGDPAGRPDRARASPSSTSASSTTPAGAALALGADGGQRPHPAPRSGWPWAICSTACPSTAPTSSPATSATCSRPSACGPGVTSLVLSLLWAPPTSR